MQGWPTFELIRQGRPWMLSSTKYKTNNQNKHSTGMEIKFCSSSKKKSKMDITIFGKKYLHCVL